MGKPKHVAKAKVTGWHKVFAVISTLTVLSIPLFDGVTRVAVIYEWWFT